MEENIFRFTTATLKYKNRIKNLYYDFLIVKKKKKLNSKSQYEYHSETQFHNPKD